MKTLLHTLHLLFPALCTGLIFFTLTSCAKLAQNNVEHSVSLPEGHRMHFSGKGAGAGMMLSSSMGPMGIAIGVAIDEGIAKEIGEAAGKAEFDIAQIVKAAFDRSKINQPLNVVVAHYGFVTAPSEEGVDDPVLPKLVLNVIGENLSKAIELDVYAGVAEGLCEKQAVELASVKSDGALVHTAFMVAAECSAVLVLEQAYN